MIETYTRQGWRDFNQRYKGVYGFFQQANGTEILVYVSNVSEERVDFTDCNDITYVAYPDKDVKFKFIPITKRMFMLEGAPTLATRVPARQYRRGICADNTVMYSYSKGGCAVNFDSVNAFLAPIEVSSPLTSDVGLLSSMFSFSWGSVYLYNELIGTIAGGKIHMIDKLFTQELIDCLRISNIKMEVV